MEKLEDLLKALLTNGLKYLPRKCQLLEKNCNIWRMLFFIKEKNAYAKPLRSRVETFQKLKPQLHSNVVEVLQARLIFLTCFSQN